MRLPRGTSLLVDTGAPTNLAGSEWTADHARELHSADLPPPHHSKRPAPLPCSGIGTGGQVAEYDVEVPIGLGGGRLDGYRAAELPNSRTPALPGRLAMNDKRVLLDTFLARAALQRSPSRRRPFALRRFRPRNPECGSSATTTRR